MPSWALGPVSRGLVWGILSGKCVSIVKSQILSLRSGSSYSGGSDSSNGKGKGKGKGNGSGSSSSSSSSSKQQ